MVDSLGQQLLLKSLLCGDAVIEFGANFSACVRKLELIRCVEGEAEEDDGLLRKLLLNPLLGSLDDSVAI